MDLDTRRPVRLDLPVQWGDMDALGHVNNTVYFRWFESARIAYMARVGYPVEPGADVGPILASTSCSFRAPLFYPDRVEVSIGVSRLGGKSFTLAIEVSSGAGVAATGDAVMVWYDYRAQASIPLDERLRASITDLEGASGDPVP